jgi:hypothetical protein
MKIKSQALLQSASGAMGTITHSNRAAIGTKVTLKAILYAIEASTKIVK